MILLIIRLALLHHETLIFSRRDLLNPLYFPYRYVSVEKAFRVSLNLSEKESV